MIDNFTNITTTIVASDFDFSSGLVPSGVYQQGFEKICYLNQVAILNSMEKLPVGLFIFITLALLGLLFQVYIVPVLKGKWIEYHGSFGLMMSLGCLVWAFILGLALTFKIGLQGWKNLELGAVIVVVCMLSVWAYQNKEKIKEAIKGFKDEKI